MSPRTPDLGAYIARQRAARGLSLAQLAAAVGGVSKQVVAEWEKGTKTPRMENIGRLAEVFGDDFEDLLELAGDELPDGVPALEPYLRRRYGFSDEAVAEAKRFFKRLEKKYPKEGGDGAKRA
ncbi:MAG: helix-turn-helix domain-containing protein [Conexibacter sp.]